MRQLPALVLLVSLSSLAASLWMRDRLPGRDGVLPQLDAEPVQVRTIEPPFTTQVGARRYSVSPLFQYELHGLVVSRHDTSAWWDVVHRDWGDQLNVADLCVIWGANLRNDAYRGLRYWSGTWTCNVGTQDEALWAQFDPDALSNNHLLTADPAVAKALRGVRVGDQVRVRGYLAEYGHDDNGGFRRGTSVVRTDRGNGACETIWVTDAAVLRRANTGWRRLHGIALAGIALAVLLWWLAPVRARDD